MNPGYILFIQACSVFWQDPANRDLRINLRLAFDKYQFLGICAILWRFVPLRSRVWWEVERSSLGKKYHTKDLDKYKSNIRFLAERALKEIEN